MPQGHQNRYDSQSSQRRARMIDRQTMVAIRRPVHTPVRRSLDGMVDDMPAADRTSPPKAVATPLPAIARTSHARPKPAMPRQARSAVLARQMVQKKPKKRIPHVTQKSRVSGLLIVMALVVFSGGSLVSYLGWQAGKAANAQAGVLAQNIEKVAQATDESPSEEAISAEALANYHVAPERPRYLKIPRLQVKARIVGQVAKSSGEISAPNNIADAGWYDSSSSPGEEGSVLINGHVVGATKSGIFHRLGNLREGDTIEIERGDGKIFSYKVIKLEAIDHDKLDMARMLSSIEPGKPGLNLITHSSRYDIRTNKYEQRLVVYAVQQN
jgi:LPXTG-site transpeptidase (sortase) family protein